MSEYKVNFIKSIERYEVRDGLFQVALCVFVTHANKICDALNNAAKVQELEAKIADLQHEVTRNEILIQMADILITNNNAKKDWEDAKSKRFM